MKIAIVRGQTRSPQTNKLAKTLAQSGHDVKLLVWERERKYQSIEKNELYTLYRFHLKAPYDRLIVLFYLPIWWFYQLYFLLKNDLDVIHACDLDTLLPAVLAKLIKRTKLCYTIFDFYADILPAVSTLIPHFIITAVASLERFLIRFTDVLFLVNEAQHEEIKGSKINKMACIYNSPPDYLSTKPVPKSASGVSIFYAGGIHQTRGLEYMITAVENLDNAQLVIAGLSSGKRAYHPKFTDSDKICCIGRIPYEEVIKRSVNADILFAFYDPEIPNNRYASPNKLFEAMMCAKPLIISDGSWASGIVKKENCGIVVPYGDVSAIKEAIFRLKNNPELRRKLGENGRRAYENRYSWEIMKERLIHAYSQL